jgi:hypothetical protein
VVQHYFDGLKDAYDLPSDLELYRVVLDFDVRPRQEIEKRQRHVAALTSMLSSRHLPRHLWQAIASVIGRESPLPTERGCRHEVHLVGRFANGRSSLAVLAVGRRAVADDVTLNHVHHILGNVRGQVGNALQLPRH